MATKRKKATVKKSVRAKSSSAASSKVTSKSKVGNLPAKDNRRAFKLKKLYVILAIVFVALALLIFNYRGLFVAAVVNGEPISRLEIVKEAEKQSGKQTINNLVRNRLIEQEARKQKVTVSEQEIKDEVKKVEQTLSKQGQKLDQVLAMEGINRDDLRKLLRLNKLIEKMVGKDIKISDKEIADYIEKNKDSLPQDQTEEQLKQTVSKELRQQALNQKLQKWLADLQGKAKIQYFVQY